MTQIECHPSINAVVLTLTGGDFATGQRKLDRQVSVGNYASGPR